MAGRSGSIVQPWHDWEIEALKEAWPLGGVKTAQEALPHRSSISIRGKADHLRLRMEGRAAYRKQPTSEWIDAALRRAYRSPTPRLAKLAQKLDRTPGWLKWRAGILGLRRQAESQNRLWNEEEQRILDDALDAGWGVSTIHTRLRKAGYHRSLTAIRTRITDQGKSFHRRHWNANEVSQLFGVDSHSVVLWIKKGWLSAKRVTGPSSDYWPDELDERRLMYAITPAHLHQFMLEYPHAWDHRRMRVEVLLDLLCGGEHGLCSENFGAAGHG